MNILQSLADQAKKKKDQLVHDIAAAPQAVGNAVAHIGAAPHPVNTAPAPVINAIQNAKYGVLAHNPAAQQNVIHQLHTPVAPRPSISTGLANLGEAQNQAVMKTIVQPFIARPAMEVAQTARQAITKRPSTYTPGSPMQRELFGNTPVASIQKKVGDQYQRQSTSSNPLLRLASRPLAAGEAAVSVANDIPVVGGLTKGLVKGTAKVAPELAKVAENVAPKAAPALRQIGQGAQKTAQTLDKGAVATGKAVNRQVQASHAKQGVAADYDATINNLTRQKAALQQRIQNTTNFRGVETTQKHIDQIDDQIAQTKAAKPKLTLKDRLLSPNIGLSMKAVHDPNLTPEQNTFIEQYAEMKKSLGQGNGVDLIPGADGGKVRVSNNYRDPGVGSGRLTNADWFDHARAEIESGKGAYGASDEYRQLGQPPAEAPLDIPAGFDTIGQPTVPKATPKPQLPDAAVPAQAPKARGTGGVSLPEYGTKQVSGIDKAFRSTRSIIERQGEHGKALANELQKARDTQEIYQAQLAKQLPTVRSLKGKDFENFVEATQGKTAAASPKVEQAIKEWQAVHPTIRQRAVDAGLDVGDLGLNYYPHFIDYQKIFKDKNTFNQALNHLVETGQAKTTEDAMTLLNHVKDVSRNRSFGNLEAQRLVDLPMYDKTPNSLVSYLSSSAKRIAQTEHFGAKDEKALKLITQAGKQGYDTQAMKDAYDVAAGAKRYGETATNFSNKARSFQSTTRLGLGALTNASQNVNTGIVTGHIRTLGAMAKQLSPKTRSFVADTGVIGDAVLNDIKTQSGFTGKVLGKITAPGFGKVETFNRSVAATAGRDYALRLAQKGDEATLRKLGVTGNIEGKTLTEVQQVQAARKVVEKTQFKVDAQDLPGWTDSPGGKLVSQFRTFSYSQSKFFSNEIAKPAAKGNFMPLARLIAALPVGYGLYEAKRVINGRPEEENKTKKGLAAFQNVGGAGLAFDIYQSLNPTNSQYLPADRRVSMGVSTIGGPTAGLAAQGIGALNDLIQRKNTPDDTAKLDGKLVVGNTGKTYTDATQAGRFALNQIPVVGAPIRNRVLPYKAQSQAETGKSTGTAVDQLKATEKQQNKDLKASLSPEDYKLSTLSKQDRQKLIGQGKYSQAKFDSLDNYVSNRKKQLGMATPADKTNNSIPAHSQKVLDEYNKLDAATRKSKAYKENDYDYKVAQAKYDNDRANGRLSKAQKANKETELRKAKVGSSYSKDVRELYGLSKSEVYDLLTTDENGKTYADQLKAYDQKLKDAGLISSLKYKNGFAPSTGGANGSSKSLSTLLAEFKLPGTEDVKSRSKAASLARHAGLAKRRA